MNKNEFLIRLSMIKDRKLVKLKNISLLDEECVDEASLISQLHLTTEQHQQFYCPDVSKILKWLEKDSHFLIHYHHKYYPKLLKQISSPPIILFAIGNVHLLNSPQIAMVGSRNFSEYGAQWARYFSSELSSHGLTITSGLALGIDAICHRGALNVSGNTIAVLGSGLSNITPRTNYRLAQDILENNGLILSEFMPNESARPEYFPRRNRIISGLSLGTFIVEASLKSCSLITARYALEQNRDVFSLPGDITNENCDGTHWLIQQGAYLVTKPNDILEHYANSLSWIKDHTQNEEPNNCAIIHADIFSIIHNKAISIEEIIEKSDISASEIAIKLMELELEGLIKGVSGGYIRCRSI